MSATRYPDKAAFVFYGNSISFAALRESCERLASWLYHDAGVGKGDRVLLCMQNCPQWIIAFYATIRVDAVVVPVNPMNLANEIGHYLADSEPSVVICSADVAETVAEATSLAPRSTVQRLIVSRYLDFMEAHPSPNKEAWPDWVEQQHQLPANAVEWSSALSVEVDLPPVAGGPADLALLPYTSGTTGRPKGCMHPHSTVMHNVIAATIWTNASAARVWLSALPLYHVAGMLAGMHSPIFAGATTIIMGRWDRTATARAIERYKVTYWSCVSTMVIDFLANPELKQYDLSSLRTIGGGGAAMPRAVAQQLKDRFNITYTEGYGLTETMGATHRNPPDQPKLQCLGVPFLGTEARVVDPDTLAERPVGEQGEIIVRGPQVFQGYWRNSEATDAVFAEIGGERFLRTGDIGYVDEDGYYFLTDRLKRMINASGYKVWPAEVESILFEHPEVREACVISTPDPYRGETVKAVVVLRSEGSGLTPEALIDWARTRMAAYKCPHQVEFASSLPKSNAGKVLWRELQERERQRR